MEVVDIEKLYFDALGCLPENHEHCALLAATCDNYLENTKTGGK